LDNRIVDVPPTKLAVTPMVLLRIATLLSMLVTLIAGPNVRHGAGTVQGFKSLPVMETADRLFWANAAETSRNEKSIEKRTTWRLIG
jgi:hypothetical protein